METRVGGPCSLSGRDPHLQLGAPRMPECHPLAPQQTPTPIFVPLAPQGQCQSSVQFLSLSAIQNQHMLLEAESPGCWAHLSALLRLSCLPHTAISKLQGPPAKCAFQPPPLSSVKTTPDRLVPYYSNVFIAADIFNQ